MRHEELIETGGERLLTDPFFGTFGNLGYARLALPARKREELTDVDLVLLSHGHFDHLDRTFLRALPPTTPILIPKRMLFALWHAGHNVIRQQTWQPYTFGEITITPVPAVHPAIAVGFVIESEGKCVYFAGDTYFRPFMNEIRRKFTLDVALMPVTTYLIPMTMGEKEAVLAVEALDPKVVIPIHLGIQPRSPFMRTRQSPESFQQRLQQAGSKTQVVLLREGETWTGPILG